jgi:hypothetical protein
METHDCDGMVYKYSRFYASSGFDLVLLGKSNSTRSLIFAPLETETKDDVNGI